MGYRTNLICVDIPCADQRVPNLPEAIDACEETTTQRSLFEHNRRTPPAIQKHTSSDIPGHVLQRLSKIACMGWEPFHEVGRISKLRRGHGYNNRARAQQASMKPIHHILHTNIRRGKIAYHWRGYGRETWWHHQKDGRRTGPFRCTLLGARHRGQACR